MISRPGTRLPGVLTVLLLMGQPMVYGADGPPATGKPNIVLILADDVSADMFSCYGRPGSARTPEHRPHRPRRGAFPHLLCPGHLRTLPARSS